jgi:hypothetical protein
MDILVHIYVSCAMLNNTFAHHGRISRSTAWSYQLYIYPQPRLRMCRVQTVDRTNPLIECMPEPGEPAWRIPWAPPDHSIYRGHRPNGPTPPIHLLGF